MAIPPPSIELDENPPRKRPDIWWVVAVTYGAVIVLTIASLVAYYSWSQRGTDTAGPIAVGSLWVPIYPGALVVGHSSSGNDEVTETTLRFKTQDSADKLLSFYQAKLKDGRFRQSSFAKNGAGGTIRANLRDGIGQILLTVTSLPEGSEGSITTFEKRRAK
jgi:hypothetical protein